MTSRKQTNRDAKRLFRFCLIDGKLDEDRVRSVAGKILESKRRGYLALLKDFLRWVKLDSARHTAEIRSAMLLGPTFRRRVQTEIKRTYGEDINTRFAQDPGLIGGMRIKVGSDVYDGSLRFKLGLLGKYFGLADGKSAGF